MDEQQQRPPIEPQHVSPPGQVQAPAEPAEVQPHPVETPAEPAQPAQADSGDATQEVVEGDDPEPEVQINPTDADGDDVAVDNEVEVPGDLPSESFQADPNDKQGADDHPPVEPGQTTGPSANPHASEGV